jgi:hypothetical protein
MFMAFPGHRGRPVELSQRFGDGRTLDFEHRDGGVHLGQDFDRHRSVSLWLVRRAFGHPHGSNDQNLWMALGEVT